VVTIGDVIRYGSGILGVGGKIRPPMVLQLHSSTWKYEFKNNTGLPVDDIDVDFCVPKADIEMVAVIYAYDSQDGTWTCVPKKYSGFSDTRWHCDKDSGTLADHEVLTIVAQSQTKKNVKDFTWSYP